MAYYLLLPAYLLPVLVVLCGLVRVTVPHRRRLQRVVAGASLGCWLGFCMPVFYNVNHLAERVRQTELNHPNAHAVLQGLGFSGSYHDLMWGWNVLVLVCWLTLLCGWLAYWSAPRAGARPGWKTAGLLALLAGRILYYASQPVRPVAVPSPGPQPLRLTLRQPGLLPYPLGSAQVDRARYDSVCSLTLSGTLPRGETLRVLFRASALARPHTTNLVEVWAGGRLATHAFGHSAYQRATNTVTGQFSCLLPSGQPLRGAFAQAGLAIP